MTDHLRRMFRFFALMAVIPLLAGFAGVWSLMAGYLLFLLTLIGVVALLIGTLIWIGRGMKLPVPPVERRQRAMAIGLAPLLLAASIVAIGPLAFAGHYSASLIRLAINHAHYEAIIAKARATPGQRYGQDGDLDYVTAPGPPMRVAFRYGEMRQPWGATVYDPGGKEMQAKGRDRLGLTMGCRHLWGDYYTCWEDD